MTQPAAAERAAGGPRGNRRERILDAAVELAEEGGYDAVQMREVAERADVALGTLYRYFPSKTHLLVSALGRTFAELQSTVRLGPSGTAEERVYRVVATVTRYLARHRRLSGALIRALMSADAAAGAEVDAVGGLLVGFIASATRSATSETGEPMPAGAEDELVAHIIGKVWLVDVVTLLSGRMTVSAVLEDLRHTIALVMGGGVSPPRDA